MMNDEVRGELGDDGADDKCVLNFGWKSCREETTWKN
jgi:hypothetical protein